MKVLLIFPPLWIPYRPYLSLPSLCAYLKGKGIDVIQKDFNAEAYDMLLSEDYLKGLKGRLEDRFKAVEAKSRLMPGIEQEYYYDLYKAKSSVSHIAERIESAKGVFRNKKAFYDINALSNARETLKQAQIIISTGCFPTGQDLIWPMNTRFQRSLSDIDKLTQNREENPFLEIYEKQLLPFVAEHDPDIVGISIAADGQLMPALTLSRLIKSSRKKTHVVIGGCITTLLADVLMQHRELFDLYFDSAVLNEGEKPLLRLAENISQGKTLEDVPNLIYADNGNIRANAVLPAEDVNSLPTPCFDGLPFDLYLNPELVLPILSSRGCYWGRCAFCSHGESYRFRYQSREAGKLADDIQELSRKHGVSHFSFSDECMSPSSAGQLSDELIKRGIKARYSTNVRLERQFTPELCNKMFQAGFRILHFGLESGCDRILDHMDKGITKETAIEVCRNAYNAGLWVHLYVFFGFPTETRAEAQQTIDFLLANRDIVHSFNIDNFILAKGAPVKKHPQQYGVSSIDTSPSNDFNFAYSYSVSSGLTSSEALELSIASRESIAREYKSQKFFKLDGDDMLLYISHFEQSDPYLRAAIKAKAAGTQAAKKASRKSVPRIKRNVVLDHLRFDVLNIIRNITDAKNMTAYPRATAAIFDPVSGKIWSISPQIAEVLALCDGSRSIQQIAHELSRKYNAPGLKVEEECIDWLKPLLKEGYVLV
jgi:anaerobic magnesium-protoporphyrin IX monomethyl ester cyclase